MDVEDTGRVQGFELRDIVYALGGGGWQTTIFSCAHTWRVMGT